jgi:adenylate cyclase
MVLRSGTWTILFTDVVGSTEQRVRVGDALAEELRREHDRIVRVAASRCDGVVVKGTGDGAMMALSSAADALMASIYIQQYFDRRNRNAAEPFSVRIGVALGDVHYESDDMFGTPVVEAARTCAFADAGEILVSDLVRAVAGSRAPCELVSRGAHEMKGLPAPVTLWSVPWVKCRRRPRCSLRRRIRGGCRRNLLARGNLVKSGIRWYRAR